MLVETIVKAHSIGCGMCRWVVEGGVIELPEQRLQEVLERAYDPWMPDWTSLITEDDFQ